VDSLGLMSRPVSAVVTVEIPMVAVPDVAKKTLDAAKASLKKAGLTLGKVEAKPGKGTPGLVLGQDPKAGVQAKKGSAVNLQVGAEPEKVPVPNLTGKTLADAKALLSKSGLSAGKVTQAPGKGKVGTVVGQTPAAGAQVVKGSAVALEIGAAKKPELIPVPNVVGKKLADAKAALTKAGLVAGKETARPGKGEPGVVVGQKPKAGTQVAKGLIVDLEVGAKKRAGLIPVPEVVGKKLSDAKAALEKAGLVQGKVTSSPGKGKPGVVLSQNPKAGTKVAPGWVVHLEVGAEKGTDLVSVPNVVGKKLADAKAAVRKAGLEPGKVTNVPGKGRPGLVVGQKPKAGDKVARGLIVDFEVGAEKKPEKIRVPDVSGKTTAAARAAIEGARLKVGTVTPMPGQGEPGKVVGQTPAAGAQVEPGTRVNLEVGAEKVIVKVKVPDLAGATIDEAKAKLRAVGLVFGRLKSVPGQGQPGKVFAQSPAAGQEVNKGTAVSVEVFAGKAGTVLNQTPPAGRNVREGSAVDLVVAREPAGELAEVPNLEGLSLSEAGKKLAALGLKVADEIRSKVDDVVAPGKVLAQDPAAGKKVERGTAIILTISKRGEVVYTVPDVVGKKLAEAEEILKGEGFGLGKMDTKPAAPAKEGTILSQEPKGGEKTKSRGAVNLVVAVKPEKMVKLPALLGLQRARAEEVIQAAGLRLGAVKTEIRPDDEEGIVVKQDPAAGTEVLPGSIVDLVVSKQPADMVRVPVILRLTLDEAKKALEDAGLVLGKVTKGKKHMKEIVVRQFPYPRKKVVKGTKIDVTVTVK
jgi:beta-lactam-binding protein with PASTA domain